MSPKKSLAETHPHLLEEWDYRKNQLLGLGDPEKLTHGSNKKAQWKCPQGHSWKATICKRTFGRGCPYCSNQKVGYGNDLLTNHPELCEEWDFEKNNLGPENYLPGAGTKVWWVCEKGHSWLAIINNRTKHKRPSDCPYCSNRKVGYGNDLLTNHRERCQEWDFEKNELGPDKYVSGSHKKVWWKCSEGHSWKAFIYSRVNGGHTCKYCANRAVGYGNDLLTNHPELCQEWDFEKNKLGPENYTPGSGERVWWKCSKGHSWKSLIYTRPQGRGCPYCSGNKVGYGNDLLTNHPELCQEWDFDKNKLGPENYLPMSGKRVWWVCRHGHSYEAYVHHRAKGSGCKQCAENSKASKISQKWLDSLGIKQREVKIGPYRVDGFDPETNTVYEFFGDYWHGNPKIFSAQEINPTSKKSFGKLYLETKRRIFRLEKKGYKVVYIWESDFLNKNRRY